MFIKALTLFDNGGKNMNLMKKCASLLLAVMLLTCFCTSALASTEGTSTWMSGLGWEPEEFVENDFSRACAVVLSMLDAADTCELNLDDIDWGKTCYVGLTPSGIGVDVFVGKSDGYFDTVWYGFDNTISLYTFITYTEEDIFANNPEVTYYAVPDESITEVLDVLNSAD